MKENKVSNTYIKNKFKTNYCVSILITGIFTIALFAMTILSILSNLPFTDAFRTFFFLALILNIILIYAQYNNKNCTSYQIVEYLGKKQELENDGYEIIYQDNVIVTGIKELPN